MDAMEDLRFEKGAMLTEFAKTKINESEISYFETYSKILSDYMVDTGIDITKLMNPPKKLKVQVKVLQDIGQLETENGCVNFVKNSVQNVNLSDVEIFIRRNQMQIIE